MTNPEIRLAEQREMLIMESKKRYHNTEHISVNVVSKIRDLMVGGQLESAAVREIFDSNREQIGLFLENSQYIKKNFGNEYIDHDLGNIVTVVEGFMDFFLKVSGACDRHSFQSLSNSWERYYVAIQDVYMRTINANEVPDEFNTGLDLGVIREVVNYFGGKEMVKMSANTSVYKNLNKKQVSFPTDANWEAIQAKLEGKKIMGNTAVIGNFAVNELRNILRDVVGAEHISVSVKVLPSEVSIRFEDDGCGMNREQLGSDNEKSIFHKGTSGTGSTGLGIANFDSRVVSMGASMYVLSKPQYNEKMVRGSSDELEISDTLEATMPDPLTGVKAYVKHFSDPRLEPARFRWGGDDLKMAKVPFVDSDHGTVFEIRLPIINQE